MLVCNRVKGNRTSESQTAAAKGNAGVTAAHRQSRGETASFLWCLQYICRIGTVHRITDRGDVRVQYSNNIRWTFHPGALTKVSANRKASPKTGLLYMFLFINTSHVCPLGEHVWSGRAGESPGGHGQCEEAAGWPWRVDRQHDTCMLFEPRHSACY